MSLSRSRFPQLWSCKTVVVSRMESSTPTTGRRVPFCSEIISTPGARLWAYLTGKFYKFPLPVPFSARKTLPQPPRALSWQTEDNFCCSSYKWTRYTHITRTMRMKHSYNALTWCTALLLTRYATYRTTNTFSRISFQNNSTLPIWYLNPIRTPVKCK